MSNGRETSRISFRPAGSEDFEYCAALYFAGRESVIQASDIADLRRRWEVDQVRMIVLDDTDVGWLQSTPQGDTTFIVQLFIEAHFQGQGIGTEVLHRVIDESRERGRAVTLGVVKTNPALRLYERLGFRITHEDERKFYMRRELA